ncbi:chemotaxis response regulator protein-glutamate methylesterase [Marivivens donghaensis]|uniref:Protein-glutamate methylesterase/protein-glutamine glutaminase n=1 Tax=Marivivens donghaensis TaxID=1699413 RepID=A0ABX0VSL3_9RHOB|nr:chemotaxis response regulator protein-glutamate methylesterase [Marivivens donghaensis]NIY70896.1 chemotaxis response regulator protein-glutamate methylesterase [Marivivens donghaensis]
MPSSQPIRVLIVDDSAMIRRVLAMGIDREPDLEVVGFASNGEQALDLMQRMRPDVITLDLEMPSMDGLTFMRSYMKSTPIPTIVISSATTGNRSIALQAVEAGAVDIISKPQGGTNVGLASMMVDVCQRIREAASAKTGLASNKSRVIAEALGAAPIQVPAGRAASWVHAIGASTGGIQALSTMLPLFPANSPGIVIVQHMPEGFTASFAARLNTICPMDVREAKDGDIVQPGRILLAPGGARHMMLVRFSMGYRVSLIDGDPVCYSRPSVDVLFHSVAKECGRRCSASILTGMGRDGAEGMLSIRRAGGATFAQNEATCVVYGMPQAAHQMGAASKMLPLEDIPAAMTHAMGAPVRPSLKQP